MAFSEQGGLAGRLIQSNESVSTEVRLSSITKRDRDRARYAEQQGIKRQARNAKSGKRGFGSAAHA